MQFRDFGRERTTSRMCGAGKEMRVKDVGGGGVAKVEEEVDIAGADAVKMRVLWRG